MSSITTDTFNFSGVTPGQRPPVGSFIVGFDTADNNLKKMDHAGTLSGIGTPAGSAGALQYNNAGGFGGFWNFDGTNLLVPTGEYITGASGIGSRIDLTDNAFIITTDGGTNNTPSLSMTSSFGTYTSLLTSAVGGSFGGILSLVYNSFGGSASLLLNTSDSLGNSGLIIEETAGSHYIVNLQAGNYIPGGFPSGDQINIVTVNSNGTINIIPGSSGGIFLNTPLFFQGTSGNTEIIVTSTTTTQATVPNKTGTFVFTRDMVVQLLSKNSGVDFNTTGDTTLTLSGTTSSNTAGASFIITDIVITNVSTSLTTAYDAEIWTGTSRSGSEIAHTRIIGAGTDTLSYLTASNKYINTSLNSSFTSAPFSNVVMDDVNTAVGTTLYFSLGTAQGATATADVYIYGYVIA
jgi:hypothetical protein